MHILFVRLYGTQTVYFVVNMGVNKSVRRQAKPRADCAYAQYHLPSGTEQLVHMHQQRHDIIYVELRLLNVWSNSHTSTILHCTTESTVLSIVQHIQSIHHIASHVKLYLSSDVNSNMISNLLMKLKELDNVHGSKLHDVNNKLILYYDYTPINSCPILMKQPTAALTDSAKLLQFSTAH